MGIDHAARLPLEQTREHRDPVRREVARGVARHGAERIGQNVGDDQVVRPEGADQRVAVAFARQAADAVLDAG